MTLCIQVQSAVNRRWVQGQARSTWPALVLVQLGHPQVAAGKASSPLHQGARLGQQHLGVARHQLVGHRLACSITAALRAADQGPRPGQQRL